MAYPDLDPAGISPSILNFLIFSKDDFLMANPSIEEVSNSGMLLLTVSGFDSVLPIESFKKMLSVENENLCLNTTFKALEKFIFLIFQYFCSHQFSHLFFPKEIYL